MKRHVSAYSEAIIRFHNATYVTHIDLLIAIRAPPPNANNDRAQEA